MVRGVRVEERLVRELVCFPKSESQQNVVGLGEPFHPAPKLELIDVLMRGEHACLRQLEPESAFIHRYLSSTLRVKPTLCSISTCSSMRPNSII